MSLYLKHYFDNKLPNMWSMSMNIQTTDTYYYKMQYVFLGKMEYRYAKYILY
jgi:hypothetical protein